MFRIGSRSWPLKIYFTQNLKRWELGRLLDKCPALVTSNSRRHQLGQKTPHGISILAGRMQNGLRVGKPGGNWLGCRVIYTGFLEVFLCEAKPRNDWNSFVHSLRWSRISRS